MLSDHRSISQVQSYEKCPYSYYLSRVQKVWRRPAAWLAQGTAFHVVAEKLHKREINSDVAAVDLFTETYVREINEKTRETPNLGWWFSSGRYRGEEDIVRRHGIGLEQVDRFMQYMKFTNDVIWIAPDGKPGIELEFDIDLDGVQVKGYIDAVLDRGDVVVRDYKTGNSPGDDFQLATYSLALAEMFDIERPEEGHYWMARTGKETFPYDLTAWSREEIVERFHDADEGIRAERFDPQPGDHCRFCDVSYSCEWACG